MPPKKRKEDGGGGKAKADEAGAVLSMFQQLDQEKMNALGRRVDEAVTEKLELQRLLDKGEKDTHEFVNYFQLELEKKDSLVAQQREKLKAADDAMESALHELTERYEGELKAERDDRSKVELGLRSRLRIVEEELQKLDAFRESKKLMEARIAQLEREAKETAERHLIESADNERRFVTDKAKVQREFELKLRQVKAKAKAAQAVTTNVLRSSSLPLSAEGILFLFLPVRAKGQGACQ